MNKVDLHAKNEIVDEAINKACYPVQIDDSNQEYILEDYASRIYQNIRNIYDIKNTDLSKCFGRAALPDLDVKISTGKGGAFFLKNKNHSELLIKSITPGEYEIFKQFTDKYYMYLLFHPDTFLTPIFGVFTLSLSENYTIPDIHFIVMKSVFDPNLVSEHQKMMVFDLKGSEHGRKTLKTKHEQSQVRDIRTCPRSLISETLKDLDFNNTLESLFIENPSLLTAQMIYDTNFLAKNNFMDYSLLVFVVYDYGKHMKDPDQWEEINAEDAKTESEGENQPEIEAEGKHNQYDEIDLESNLPSENGVSSFVQDEIDEHGYPYKRYIYFGIIDYLTSFGFQKRLEERFRKTYSKNSSCVHPAIYGSRFNEYMKQVIGIE